MELGLVGQGPLPLVYYLRSLPLSHLHHIHHPWHQQLTRHSSFSEVLSNFRQSRSSGRGAGSLSSPWPCLVTHLATVRSSSPFMFLAHTTIIKRSRVAGIVESSVGRSELVQTCADISGQLVARWVLGVRLLLISLNRRVSCFIL